MLDLKTKRQLGAIQRQNIAYTRRSLIMRVAGSVTAPMQGGATGTPHLAEGVSSQHTDGSQYFLLGLMGLTDDVYVE